MDETEGETSIETEVKTEAEKENIPGWKMKQKLSIWNLETFS